jgi:hypothetical protein
MHYRFYVVSIELDSAKLLASLKEYNVITVSMTYDYIELDFSEEPSTDTLNTIKEILKASRYEKIEYAF